MLLVRRDGKGQVELLHQKQEDWFYWIPEKELETRRGLIRWIRQLSEKNWITREHIGQLIRIAEDIGCKRPV